MTFLVVPYFCFRLSVSFLIIASNPVKCLCNCTFICSYTRRSTGRNQGLCSSLCSHCAWRTLGVIGAHYNCVEWADEWKESINQAQLGKVCHGWKWGRGSSLTQSHRDCRFQLTAGFQSEVLSPWALCCWVGMLSHRDIQFLPNQLSIPKDSSTLTVILLLPLHSSPTFQEGWWVHLNGWLRPSPGRPFTPWKSSLALGESVKGGSHPRAIVWT